MLGMGGRGGGHFDPSAVGRDANPGDLPPSLMEKLSHTHPRLTHYVLMLAFLGVTMQCSSVFAAYAAARGDGDGTGARAAALRSAAPSGFAVVGATAAFLLWPIGFTAYVFRTIRKKVVLEKRAGLLRDEKRTEGYLAWCDMPPACWSMPHRIRGFPD